jgi:hypothetical protein
MGYFMEFGEKITPYFQFIEDYSGNVLIKLLMLVLLLISFFLIVPLSPVIFLYFCLRYSLSLRLDPALLSARLWRIVVGIGVVIVLNYLSLWIEQQSWSAQIVR